MSEKYGKNNQRGRRRKIYRRSPDWAALGPLLIRIALRLAEWFSDGSSGEG